MPKSFWEIIIPAIAVVLSLIQVVNKKKIRDKTKNKEKESTLLSQTAKARPGLRGRVIYEGYLSQMYPQAIKTADVREEPIVEAIVVEPATTDAEPERKSCPEIDSRETALKGKGKKEKATAPLAEFNNPAAILQGIIFSEVLSQPKAKNKFRYR